VVYNSIENPSQSHGASPAMWEPHSITCYSTQANALRFNISQIYLFRKDRRLSW